MKAIKTFKILAISILGSLILFPVSSMAQEEYDDMYFTPTDRKEIKSESIYAARNDQAKSEAGQKEVINPSYSTQVYGEAQENYSAKNVNPEYIERYKSNSKDSESADEDAYYVENYDRSKFSEGDTENKSYSQYGYPGSYSQYGYPGSYYGYNSPFYSGFNYYGRSYYDPFWNPYYGSGWGFSPGLSLSLSFGTGWGYSPWSSPYYGMGYNPWYGRHYYNSWAYNPWYYDPWYGPSYYGMGMGYAFYPGYYSNHYYYYGGNEYRQSSPYNRRVSRGSDNYLVKDGTAPNRRTATVSDQKISDTQNLNNRARTSRDYSRTQNEYYTRSRSGANYTSRTGNSSSVNMERSRNNIGTTSTPRIRSSRSDIDYSRPSYRSATQSRSNANTYNYNGNRSTNRSSSWSGNSYQRSRSGNHYSSPSRSSGSYSGSSFGSGSRSSYSGGSSAPTRSSGSSGSSSRSGGRR
jgi:hypothetical protein